METRCISSDRETILRILERETGETAREGGPPGFSVTVGGFALLRDGRLTAGEEGARVFPLLAGLGLCDWPWAPAPLPPETILCPMAGWDGGSLRNLLAILSARQVLLNKALDAKRAFFVAPSLMRSLAAHPPETAVELLRALWGREEELRGVQNLNVDVSEDNGNIVFLHKIVPGSASRSYGIHVARLAGVPAVLLNNAEDKLLRLEEEGAAGSVTKAFSAPPRKDEPQQLSFFAPEDNPAIEELRKLDLMEVTPSQAIRILEDLKDMIDD